MASMPDTAATVMIRIEFDEDTVARIKQLIRDEIAMYAANSLTAAVDRRDGTGNWHRVAAEGVER